MHHVIQLAEHAQTPQTAHHAQQANSYTTGFAIRAALQLPPCTTNTMAYALHVSLNAHLV